MIAIVAGFFLVAYLLAPGAIYRLLFSIRIPSKRFQRNRTEEIVFSVLATTLPFLLTCALLFVTPLGRVPRFGGPVEKHEAYKQLFDSLTSDKVPPIASPSAAYWRAFREQARFVVWLWFFCSVEALVAVLLVTRYGDYAKGSRRKWFCEKCLLVHVSEWQLLFTTLTLPSSDRHLIVEVDVLTTHDSLYRGRLTDWFTELDGSLAGLFLESAERYRRDQLTRDRENNITKPTSSYWKSIPGSNMYIRADTIANYNIRYVDPRVSQLAQDVFGGDVTASPIDTGASAGGTKTTEPSPHP